MSIELRHLSVNDGVDVFDMLQKIPKNENGFMNVCNGITVGGYRMGYR